MTISSLSDYRNSLRERPIFNKLAARAYNATWGTLWDATGSPAAGTLAVGNTANGVVPTDATTGAPAINFSSGTGYLTEVDAGLRASAPNRIVVYDRLFHAGAYAFNAAVTLASQPSFSSRVPGGTDFTGLQLWFEAVTTFTGNPSIAVTYTDESGNAAHTTGTIAFGSAPSIGVMKQLPLQAGDTGIQKIESVTATVASAGTFNILVIRPVWSWRFNEIEVSAPAGVEDYTRHWMDRTGMPRIFPDSCLAAMCLPDSNNTPLLDLAMEIASL